MTSHRTKAERRTQILEAAGRCFARRGFHEASMDEVAAEAGLSKGSLYWHFPSKRDVFKSLMDQWFEELGVVFADRLAEEESARGRLLALFAVMEESAAIRPDMVRAQIEFFSIALRDPEYLDWMRGVYSRFMGDLEMVIEGGIASGEFRRLDPWAVAGIISGAVDGLVMHRFAFTGGKVEPPAWDNVSNTLLAMLEA